MKKNWVIILVIVLVVLGVWWLVRGGASNDYGLPSISYSSSPSASGAPAVSGTHGTAVTATPMATSTLSYSQLVQTYGNDRIQFDNNCQAHPQTVSYKNGTSILLDNRANQTRTIGLGGKTYVLGPYGYQVITLSGAVPQKLGLSCNALVNVGTINLEADISGQ